MKNIQKEKESFWGKLMRKNKVNSYEIATKTNIPEEKVKEIVSGERILPAAKVNDFVTAIHETGKENKRGKRNEALLFFADKDIKELRLKFNYRTQADLAKVLKVSQYTVSRAEMKGPGSLNTSTLLKFYNFFKDELNIKIGSVKETKESYKIVNTKNNDIKDNDVKDNDVKEKEYEFYKNYFKENNMKDLIESKGVSVVSFARNIGINPSTIYKFVGNRANLSLDMYKRLYDAIIDTPSYTDENDIDNNQIEEIKQVDIESLINNDLEEIETNTIPQQTREDKFGCIYKEIEEDPIEMVEEIHYSVYSKFDSKELFEFLINNCITKDVVDLYKSLDLYFKG